MALQAQPLATTTTIPPPIPHLDPTEVSLGIAVYLSPTDGFSGVSKARCSDFVVHEVALDGTVARLESIEPTIHNDENVVVGDDGRKRKRVDDPSDALTTTTTTEATVSTAPAPPPGTSSMDWSARSSELAHWVGTEVATTVTEFLQRASSTSQSDVHGSNHHSLPVDTTITTTAPASTTRTENSATTMSKDDATATTTTTTNAVSSPHSSQHQQHFVTLPALPDKDTRRNVHHWIRSALSSVALADTMDGGGGAIRVWHLRYAQHMPQKFDNPGPGRRTTKGGHVRAPRDKPYLRFVVYKENMDTGGALQQIARKAMVGGGRGRGRGGRGRGGGHGRIRIGYAGNKDKRGITTQFVTVPARDTSVKHLCNVFNGRYQANHGDGAAATTNAAGGASAGCGHTTASTGFSLLRLGNFEYVAQELRLGRLRGNRFDVALRNVQVTTTIPTNVSAKLILQQAVDSIRQTGFINYFGTQRFGKFHDTHLTGMAILRGDYEGAIDIILRPKGDEQERPDIHAARVKWMARFSEKPEDRAKAEKDCANLVLGAMNRFMQSEIAVLESLLRFPLDYKKALSCITKTMRMMFIHAVQSYLWNKIASFRIEKLGLQVVKGDLVVVADGATKTDDRDGLPQVKAVTDNDIAAGTYTMEDVVIPLIGVKTQNPDNDSGMLFERILKECEITRAMIDNLADRDFHCAGDYRKLICRPSDVDFDTIEYTDENQPLLRTDIMKLSGIELPTPARASDGTATAPAARTLLGMVVGFTLPSSSYATIFLRELMKRPTSSEYQRELALGDTNTKE